jgi:hypothetical protein
VISRWSVGMGVVGVLHLRPHTVFLDCTVPRTEYLRNNKLAITPYAGQAWHGVAWCPPGGSVMPHIPAEYVPVSQ